MAYESIMEKLNHSDTYAKMYWFLDQYWERTKLDDLGGLLSDMDPMNPFIWTGGLPIDTLLIDNWNEVTQEAQDVTAEDGFDFMIEFLIIQLNWMKVDVLVDDLKSAKRHKNELWQQWLELF